MNDKIVCTRVETREPNAIMPSTQIVFLDHLANANTIKEVRSSNWTNSGIVLELGRKEGDVMHLTKDQVAWLVAELGYYLDNSHLSKKDLECQSPNIPSRKLQSSLE